MISLSLNVLDARKTILYPTATSNAFAYSGGYITKDTLQVGLGYWLKFAAKETVAITGTSVTLDTINIAEGWNMVGTVTNPVPTALITQIPGGIVVSQYFGYNAGYQPEDTLTGGKGYWVKAGIGGGKIVLASGPGANSKAVPAPDPLASMNTLTVTDKNGNRQVLYFGTDGNLVNASRYELPPAPPAGIADVRFASQRYVESIPAAITGADYPISLSGLVAPVTISWKVASGVERNYQLTDAVNGKLIGVRKLAGEGSMTVNASNLNALILKVTGAGAVPKEFSLSANYPNPFNPSTKFRVAVPQDAYVEVVVYDILGRKVATLVHDVRTAGYHTIEWNGLTDDNASAVTGVYFVRMASGSFTQIQKIMLMK